MPLLYYNSSLSLSRFNRSIAATQGWRGHPNLPKLRKQMASRHTGILPLNLSLHYGKYDLMLCLVRQASCTWRHPPQSGILLGVRMVWPIAGHMPARVHLVTVTLEQGWAWFLLQFLLFSPVAKVGWHCVNQRMVVWPTKAVDFEAWIDRSPESLGVPLWRTVLTPSWIEGLREKSSWIASWLMDVTLENLQLGFPHFLAVRVLV